VRCFLVGNGPSLKRTNLDLIAGKPSFGMNRIHLLYPVTRWRPTYFMWSDLPQREDDRTALITHIVSGEECYIRSDIYDQLLGRWRAYPEPWIKEMPDTVHPWKYHLEHLCARPGDEHWPDEWCFPEEPGVLCKLGTGMGPVMQQAIRLGYDELVLVGCDLDWHVLSGEDDSNHFSREYEANLEVHTKERADANNALGRAMHELAWAWCQEHGVKVWNATDGGALEVYPRVSLGEIL
jgi:hypothetical protein